MWCIVLLILLVLIGFLYIRHDFKYKDMNKLPGPPVNLFFGNALEFGSTIVDVFENTQRLIKTYGRIVRVWLGPFRLGLLVTDPEMVEFLLTKCECVVKPRKEYSFLRLLLGEGVGTSEGETWRKSRRMLTPAFHFKILEKFSHIFHNNIQTLVDIFAKEHGRTVDVCKPTKHFAFDVLGETSMGTSFKCQTNGDNEFIKSLDGFMDIFMRRYFSFFKNFDLIFRCTGDHTKANKFVSTMHGITDDIIRNRRGERCSSKEDIDKDDSTSSENKNRKVFMDILLDYPGLTDEEIRYQVVTFSLAGYHTTASILSIAIYELAKHIEVQQYILEEIYDIIGTDRTKVIQLDELKKMRYLSRVVKEILRMYPPAPVIIKENTTDIVYNGMKIPAYTTLMFQPFAQHRDPELFPEPEKFDPDRFLPENMLGRHPFAYIPFSAGPRNCIGMGYAIMQIETVIANVIRHFEIHPAEFPHTPVIGSDGILQFTNGLPVKLVQRE